MAVMHSRAAMATIRGSRGHVSYHRRMFTKLAKNRNPLSSPGDTDRIIRKARSGRGRAHLLVGSKTGHDRWIHSRLSDVR
jgi:hypothetical protein